jgi:hypothetical protein
VIFSLSIRPSGGRRTPIIVAARCFLLNIRSPGQQSLRSAVERSFAAQPGAAAVVDIAAYRSDLLAGSLARPGSVIKPFILEALKQHGAADAKLPCEGQLQIARRHLDSTHVHLNDALDSHGALAYSCHNRFAASARRISAQDLRQTLLTFGFASPTSLAPGEQTGTVDLAPDDDSKRLEALGEWGVRVTPLEVLAAYRRLALLAQHDRSISQDLAAAGEAGVMRSPNL